MAESAERPRQIAGERADIGAFADDGLEIGVIAVGRLRSAADSTISTGRGLSAGALSARASA